MSATIKTLKTKTKDGAEQSIYPKSVLEAIIDTETEKTLDIIINNLEEAKITVGTSANYGHVKLSDNYTESDGVADEGVGASSKAVSDCYNNLNSSLNNHTLIRTVDIYDLWSDEIDITNVKWLEIIQKDSTDNVISSDFSSVKGSYSSPNIPKAIYRGRELCFEYFVDSSTNNLSVRNENYNAYLEVYACF